MYVPIATVLTVTLSQGVGGCGTVFIDSAQASVKISRTALLAVSILKHGIRCAKGPSGLGKTLWILCFYMLKIFQRCHFRGPLRNTPEVHMHDNIIDFEKIFLKMLYYL